MPLHEFHLEPDRNEERLENVTLAFRLLEEAGLPRPRYRPQDIVHKDIKATLRLVYSLFIKYKN